MPKVRTPTAATVRSRTCGIWEARAISQLEHDHIVDVIDIGEEDGLVRDQGLGLVKYQPGTGKPIESLAAEKNCVIAMVWPQAEGEEAAEPVSWCFNAA